MDKGFETDAKHFSWNQLQPKSDALLKETMRVANDVPSDKRNAYEKAVFNLWRATFIYQQLKSSLPPPHARDWHAAPRGVLRDRHPRPPPAPNPPAPPPHRPP